MNTKEIPHAMHYVVYNVGSSDSSVPATMRGVTAKIFVVQEAVCQLGDKTDAELIEIARKGIAEKLGCETSRIRIISHDGHSCETAKEAEQNK